MQRLFCAFVMLCIATLAAPAQEAATLVADRVALEGQSRLVAEGNVEILQGTQRLQAQRVVYDQTTEQLTIDGPILLTDGDGTTIVADSAELDQGLRDGILNGARIVLDQQLQLATNQIRRVDGRYTQMRKVVATSCQVCDENDTPLWQIRARRVVHDEEERALYFEDASFHVLDLPIFYIPRMSLPDPTVQRRRGLLAPSYRSTTELGFGVKVPYFIPIGDHRDITLTPYIAPGTRTLEARYRQAFRNGDLEINMAGSNDDIRRGEFRGYIFAEGAFQLRNDYKLTFDLENTTDDGYLLEYGYSSKDRLDSEIALTRTRRDEDIYAGFTQFQSLRDEESNSTLPPLLADVSYQRRFEPARVGGILDMTAEVHSHYRYSDEQVEGLDLTNALLSAHWNRSWTFGPGLVARTDLAGFADYYVIGDDNVNYDSDTVSRFTPYAATELRWPLAQTSTNGVRHVIEPVAQLVWSDDTGNDVPNEDSTRIEFDEGNYLALNRFPGTDIYERGLRMTFGATYTRYDPDNWSLALTVARSYRDADLGQFTETSGLDGRDSDWLITTSLDFGDNLSLTNRAILDDELVFNKNEARLDWQSERLDVGSSYIWLSEDFAEDRDESISEWTVDSAFRINRNWSGTAEWRYDFGVDRAARAAMGLTWENECVRVGFRASRRFTSSESVDPSTDFDLTVAVSGFSTGGRTQPSKARACR
ncbi:LPS-assembly protein LptD [Pseudaestuariivita rosea]|uniref:LPS-assembly protein LptD n=1 Tax=Pseudaestuariivita rosea TaxID=2763263 RepID=UPI001ABACE07|nr:LPS assembly protein LptD [Pseudaestuariivita rosea]